MNKYPYFNAVLAELYIIIIVLFIQHVLPKGPDNTILAPIAMLSLFVLSVVAMGYFFLSRPILLYLNGDRKEAVLFFSKTVVTFAIITAIAFCSLAILLTINR
jgi:hypothetical protein